MSENIKRDEGLQDYMDLLEKMAEKYAKNQEKKPSPPPIKEKIEEPFKKSEKVKNIKTSQNKEKNIFKRLSNWYNNLPKKKKIIVSVIAVLLAIILTLTAVLGIFVAQKFG